MHNPIQRFEQRFKSPPAPLSEGGRGLQHVPRRVQAIQALAQWKQAGLEQPDAWLRLEIGEAFQKLICLALPGAPAVEMLPATAEMWLLLMADMDLTEEIDQPRIHKGFGLLYLHLKQWPQLADLIDNLPPRPQKAQPAPQRTAEQHADGASKLQDILDGLK
ncbi:MAG: hypothetical protein OEL57_02285 [Trichlorobacter sp.]|uniref:hypothetical protein n=1 Tax=Trichlorobacter sp. TaxID=2911007 RepID=UPI0025639EE1|nr:hypothetical protein [Trichlorobacter sp.]MDK9716719.1 hypothetical protein [Trichlorobacter sp.]